MATAKTPPTAARTDSAIAPADPVPLSDAERHCLRHAGHVVIRGRPGKMTAQIVGGDASGIVLRSNIASVDDAKALFAAYDLRLDVSP